MRVLYLTMNPNRASTTVPTEGWFRELRPNGLRPVVASNEVGAFHQWALSEGIPAYHVPLPFPNKRRPLPFLRSLWELRRIVRRHDIQLIHCNEQDIYPIGKYLGRLSGLPVVVSVHFTMERGYCEWAFAGRRCPDRMFFLSKGNLERCRAGVQSIVPESAWRLLPNGLDLNHYRPDAARREGFRRQHALGAAPIIGVACALRPRKQLEHLFEAAARLPSNVRVLLAGSAVAGDEAYAADLLRVAQQRLGGRLVHVGHLDELRGFYNSLDLFVNTSQEEACSISVIEAMACGCPVVGYASKSVDEQILPGGGEIVPQDSTDHLTGVLARWLADPDGLTAARQGARRRAEDGFDIRGLAEKLWAEYHDVLGERAAPRRSA
jgi:L-malate glycosyltransferase